MIVVVDVGTSSLRVSLLDSQGLIIHCSQSKYSLSYPEPDAVEMDMKVFTGALWAALKDSALCAEANALKVEAFAVTAQRSSVIPVDEVGEALGNALMWQDTRSFPICDALKQKKKEIYSITGMSLSTVFSSPKMQWLKENKREIYDCSYKLIGFCEYTVHQLCGAFATDTSIASRTSLFDVAALKWSDSLIDIFGIAKEKLCPIIPVGSVAGFASKRLCELFKLDSDVPVISSGGDQQCAALGQGCTRPGDIMINTGSGAYVLGLVDRPVYSFENGISCNVSALNGKWNVEGSVLSAGKTLDWVNELFFASEDEKNRYENFTRACLASPPGANGMRFSVHFAGRGTPVWDASERGAVFGLSFKNTKNDIARAVMEGIAVAVGECLEYTEKTMESCTKSVRISGGLAKDALFIRMLSAVSKKKLLYSNQSESTTLGAWINASLALGKYKTAEDAFAELNERLETSAFESSIEECELYGKIASELRLK
ncbi:hypothetical protein HRI96_02870 [Treponema parvum]|uniref:Glycerol kinase n=1 Tax=Treponema parvum TaxID=138851 RepID=A0A975EYM2_9SPIR|nr:FGGY-family carbohydrate kinase [Treponema parvum]QTQ11228.1 hypothetical protein HRI96_02870 [Treponema parvum]